MKSRNCAVSCNGLSESIDGPSRPICNSSSTDSVCCRNCSRTHSSPWPSRSIPERIDLISRISRAATLMRSSGLSVTPPDANVHAASNHISLVANSLFVVPQMYVPPLGHSITAEGCESGTYGVMTGVKPWSGATSSGAARQQLPTSPAGCPQKSNRSRRSSAHHMIIVSSRKRETSCSNDAPAKFCAFMPVGMSTAIGDSKSVIVSVVEWLE
mmetsp:Transcript_43268/g.127259  ORF Transcript_43268/g.127259 Transcript_43268/m.127259 type:complete len:213 (+) Transcript_43268:1804-2442(+)